MTEEEVNVFFEGDVPYEKVIPHRWREEVVSLGEIPTEYVAEVSNGLISEAVPVEINKRLLDESYDLIVSIGQVVPHEVVGMANYTKNVLVGCGGKDTIDKSHMLGAVFGMEKVMGKAHSPVRKVFDYAQEHFLNKHKENLDLRGSPSAAAHLIHGSTDGRFRITYAVNHLTKEEVENAGFGYLPYKEAAEKYKPEGITDGYYEGKDDTWFYISNPALGLWTV